MDDIVLFIGFGLLFLVGLLPLASVLLVLYLLIKLLAWGFKMRYSDRVCYVAWCDGSTNRDSGPKPVKLDVYNALCQMVSEQGYTIKISANDLDAVKVQKTIDQTRSMLNIK